MSIIVNSPSATDLGISNLKIAKQSPHKISQTIQHCVPTITRQSRHIARFYNNYGR